VKKVNTEYEETMIWIISLTLNGEAIPEIGKTENGRYKWLKVWRINRETGERQDIIFYATNFDDRIGKFDQQFFKNGIEPEYQIVLD